MIFAVKCGIVLDEENVVGNEKNTQTCKDFPEILIIVWKHLRCHKVYDNANILKV